jgi:hypothetical protein
MKKIKEQYTVQLDPELVGKIDKMAKDLGLTRSQLMRNLIESGYEDALLLDKIGLLGAFKFGKDFIRNIRFQIASGEITYTEKDGLKLRR